MLAAKPTLELKCAQAQDRGFVIQRGLAKCKIAVLISNHEQGIQLQIFGLDSLGSLNLILELSLGLEKRLVTLKAQL